jgi:nucleoid-associated protein YgaU
MTLATEWVSSVSVPVPSAPPTVPPRRLATVTALRPPSTPPAVAPLRLTRRGVVALTLLVGVLGLGLVWVGRLSAPAPAPGAAPHTVTVQPGDTLWSIARQVAPQRDPRAEVLALQRRNHLSGPQLTPGQALRVP